MPSHSTAVKSASKSFRTVERKLYPNVEQAAKLESFRVECCRLYNLALEMRIKAYNRRKESVSYYDQQKWLTEMRGRVESLRAVPVWFARSALIRLDNAFAAFFRRVKCGAKKKGFPRFRSVGRYRSIEFGESRDFFRDSVVFVPGIGEVCSRGRGVVGKQKTLCLVNRLGFWYAQTIVEVVNVVPIKAKSIVGIDMGLTTFATLSTGEKIENPRFYQKAQGEIRHADKTLSRKKNGSHNRVKARKKLAKVHDRIKAQRRSFAHQESRKLVNRFDLIGFEKLSIAGLAQTRMAKSIHDAAWGMFLFFVLYKAVNAGKHAVAVDPRGTSQECPRCGEIKPKKLSERIHVCECGLVLDRDHASALVVEARALAVAGASILRRDGPLPNCEGNLACSPDETGSC